MDLKTKACNIFDLREMARRRVPRGPFEFMDRGTEEEVSLRNNREVFERIRFKTRTFVDRAVDVYRQLLEQEPSNERARLRLVELETSGAGPTPPPAAVPDERAARRRALERTIAGLETLLAAVQRRGA